LNATHWLEHWVVTKRKTDSLDRKFEVMELDTRFETERKEQQITSLSRENSLKELQIRQTRYFLIALVILLIFILLLGILLIRQNRIRAEQQSAFLEQKLFRSQMNPHFIFNALSGIQGFILDKDHLKASTYLSKFSKLVRNVLDGSVYEYTSLEKEISTIESYLALQKVRYADDFNYSIDVEEDLPTADLKIPAMMIQPVVENALEHGIKFKESKGHIWIKISKSGDFLNIEVEDNGVGRANAAELEKGHQKDRASLSTSIIRERIKILNKRKKKKITFEIIDLDGGAGTKVVFKIPVIVY
jgi:sensor histidine kinase YesM